MRWSKAATLGVILVPVVGYVVHVNMALAALRVKYAAVARPGQRAVVVGGTSGIGAGIAVRLAQAQFDVTIVGRDAAKAADVLAQMGQAGEGTHTFLPCDALLVGNVKPALATAGWAAAGKPVDVLVVSQGIGAMSGRVETGEGLERKLALHHYSRQAFIEALTPNLRASAAAACTPAVLSILSAGVHGAYAGYATDPDLVTSFSLKNAADAAGLYNDVCLDHRARDAANAGIAYIHATPGGVRTGWGQTMTDGKPDMPWPIPALLRALGPLFTVSPADCAEAMLSPVWEGKPGFQLIGNTGQAMGKTAAHEEAMPVVWAHTQATLARLMA